MPIQLGRCGARAAVAGHARLPQPRLRACQRSPCVMPRQHPASLIYARDREKNEVFYEEKPSPGTPVEAPKDRAQPILEMSHRPAMDRHKHTATNRARFLLGLPSALTPRMYAPGLCEVPGYKRSHCVASVPGQSWNRACGLMGTNKNQTGKSHVLSCGCRRRLRSTGGGDAGAQPSPAASQTSTSSCGDTQTQL